MSDTALDLVTAVAMFFFITAPFWLIVIGVVLAGIVIFLGSFIVHWFWFFFGWFFRALWAILLVVLNLGAIAVVLGGIGYLIYKFVF